MKSTQAAEPSFEEALERLESVVGRLEDGELDLEKSLSAFEEGVRLVKLCSGRLEAARVRIRQLEDGPEGPVESRLALSEDPGE
ncbi:MAG: exodeoxyribonuclease VII small subunit [bacterium]|nr:exodeoxyribonuclease VII small subunit [bacterium]